MRTHWLLPAAALAALAGACSDSGTGVGAPDGGMALNADGGAPVAALFEVPAAGQHPSEFYALPFPNDLRLKPDGTMDLSDYPRPSDFIGHYIDIFAADTGGFGTNSAIYFRFSGPIDPATLPATPADSVADSASVYLVALEGPDKDRKVPLRFRFETAAQSTIGPNWLACLPYAGFPLRSATRYLAVVTDTVKAPGGAAITPADGARTTYGALLPAGALDATVFTTQDPVSLMAKIRQVVYALPEPTASGVAAGTGGSNFLEWDGTYDGPIFQTGDSPYYTSGGQIVLDAGGLPKLQRMESLRFAVTVPKSGGMPAAGWPIVLYAHGTGGSYRSFIDEGIAGELAAQGLAAISIDQVLHGPRDPTGGDPDFTFFNFQNPLAARDNVRQGALDDFQLLRLAAGLEVDGNVFDPTRIYFFGHSQGGLTGPPFLAAEPRVSGAVLSGAGGLIYIALLQKTDPVDISSVISLYVRDQPLDEFNPVIQMVQMFIEAADPTNYGPLLITRPLAGVGRKNIYQSEGIIDHAAPDPGIEAFGVSMGLSLVSPVLQPVLGLALRSLDTLAPPVMGNEDGVTGVLLQYTAKPGSDGHYVVFDVAAAQRQSAQFLATLAHTGTATLVP